METGLEIEITQGALFDYASLNAEVRIVVQQRAGEIKTLAKRVAADIVDIGGKLAEVKDRLGGNGKFNAWLESELRWSERTADNFIAVHQKFSAANFALENIATSALYLLAAPSTPAEAVEAARQLADQGERVTPGTAKQLVERAKAKRPKQVGLIDPNPPAPAELPEGAEVESVEYIDAEPETEEESREASPAPALPVARPTTVVPSAAAAKPEEGPKELPAGWIFDSSVEEGYHAIHPDRHLQTLLFAGKKEALVAAHQIEAGFAAGVTGLAGRTLTAPAAAQASAPAARPSAWMEERIEITISLLPHLDGAPDARKVLYTIAAGDRTPFYGMSVGEISEDQLPPKVRELIGKLVKSLEEEVAAAPAKKPAAKKAGKAKAAKK